MNRQFIRRKANRGTGIQNSPPKAPECHMSRYDDITIITIWTQECVLLCFTAVCCGLPLPATMKRSSLHQPRHFLRSQSNDSYVGPVCRTRFFTYCDGQMETPVLIVCYAVYKIYRAYQKGKRICDIQASIDKVSHFYSKLDDKRRRPGPALRSAIDKLESAKKKSMFGILLTLVGVDLLDDICDILCGIQDAIEGSEIVLDPSLDVDWEKYIMKFAKCSAGKIQLRKMRRR
jgi:hypothetical protein